MDRYRKIELLGTGAKGSVYLCEDLETHENVVVKIINKEKERIRDISYLKDYVIPKIVDCHENIGCVFRAFEDEENYYVVSKYYEGAKDLIDFDLDANSNFITMIEFAIIIARGVKELHDKSIAHRDLKPENILFMKIEDDLGFYRYIPIIIDFDLACIETENSKFPCGTGNVGTPMYAPPEFFRGTYANPMKGDIYSLGIIFYYLFSDGGYPFDYQGQDNQKYAIQTIYDIPEKLKTSSPILNKLVDDMIIKNYHVRPDIDHVLRTLQLVLAQTKAAPK